MVHAAPAGGPARLGNLPASGAVGRCTLSPSPTIRTTRARCPPMARTVRGALVQASWTGDKESMIQKHEERAHEAAKQGAQFILFQELFYGPYFCQVQDAQYYSYTELIPDGPDHQADAGPREADGHGRGRPDVRGGRQGLGHLLQHGRRDRFGWQVPRAIPQDPHPARQGLLGEVLLPAREHGLPGLRDRGRQGRRLHLL